MIQINNSEQTTQNAETLGERIAKQRKNHNLTQEEFSQLLGVTAQAVSKWENGASCPDIMLLPRISEILEVSIDELLGAKTKDNTEKAQIEPVVLQNEPKNLKKLKFNLHIVDNRGKTTNLSLPFGFVMRMADIGVKISSVLGTNTIDDSQLRQILELVRNGITGEVLDLTADDGTKVKIEIS